MPWEYYPATSTDGVFQVTLEELTADKDYTIVPYTTNGTIKNFGNGMNFRTASGVENGHGYVVLYPTSGLKWAVCNIGANAPQEIGGYYAWGETAEKENYSLDGTAYFDVETDNFTKYNDTDGMFELDLTDDAAYANWDGNWRTPSQTELLEL